mmetsp:Transcript_39363/g.68177  ORF Transcript_39363/g.68177 Transcript_39363/m.68177 type:complete len:273 (+) Transcript_39363:2639-3457(+)
MREAILVAMRVATASTTPHQPVWKEKHNHSWDKARAVLAVCHVVVGPTPPQRPPAKTATTTIRKTLLQGMPGAKELRVRVLRSDPSVPQPRRRTRLAMWAPSQQPRRRLAPAKGNWPIRRMLVLKTAWLLQATAVRTFTSSPARRFCLEELMVVWKAAHWLHPLHPNNPTPCSTSNNNSNSRCNNRAITSHQAALTPTTASSTPIVTTITITTATTITITVTTTLTTKATATVKIAISIPTIPPPTQILTIQRCRTARKITTLTALHPITMH